MSVLEAGPDVLAELLEISIHNILYTRKLYPESAFRRTRKYNVPVQLAVHPKVVEYIDNCIATAHKLLQKNELSRLAVTVMGENFKPVEQFVFEVSVKMESSTECPGQNFECEEDFLLDTEALARAIILRISTSDSVLKANPKGCSFTIQLYTKESTAMRMSLSGEPEDEKFPWIEADTRESEVPSGSVIPLKCTETSLGKVQLYVVESDFKQIQL
uniref:Mitotic spindle assembly checkpoint protein MAD2B n=1 Tax=Ornithodoros turicata TaxID=34597 RepID=A0A2R5LIV9_9ACAR